MKNALPHMVLNCVCAVPASSVETDCGFVKGTFSYGRIATESERLPKE